MKKAKVPFWNPPKESECRMLTGAQKQAAYREHLSQRQAQAANDDIGGSANTQTAGVGASPAIAVRGK